MPPQFGTNREFPAQSVYELQSNWDHKDGKKMLKKSECMRSNRSNILTMHRRKLKNHARFMISNEYSSIWDQPRISSSIRLEMTIQLRPQRWEEIAEKKKQIVWDQINRISWQCIDENWKVMQGSWSAMNILQFGTNREFLAQSV